MAKTIKMPKEITSKMRHDYLLALGEARYGQRLQGNPYGISSTSKQLKGGGKRG